MVNNNNRHIDRSSDIQDLLEENISDGEVTEDEDSSDVEAEDFHDDISLEDFSSGSGEEYNPDFDDIETSEIDSDDDDNSPNQVTNNATNVVGLQPIPLPVPPAPRAWVRVHTHESNVEALIRVRSGVRNLPPRNSHPVLNCWIAVKKNNKSEINLEHYCFLSYTVPLK